MSVDADKSSSKGSSWETLRVVIHALILALIVKKVSKFDPGKEAIIALGKIVTYAMVANVFFLGLEFFTAFYSAIPEHLHHFQYLYFGLHGHNELVPFMWFSAALAVVAAVLLVNPRTRAAKGTLTIACVAVVVSLWIDKGLGMVIAGFVPSPLGKVTHYAPTAPELTISLAIYAGGILIVTGLYKIALEVRGQMKTEP